MTTSSKCGACGQGPLEEHLRVAGDADDDGLIPTTSRYGVALADIVRCVSCGHMQTEPMPSGAALSEAYGEAGSDDYILEESGQRATASAILERIEAHAAPGGLVDIGCWVGFFLDEAGRRGWRGTGIEPSAFASRYAQEELGLTVIHAELMEADLPEASAGAVFLGDVIEHLPDPGRALERIHSALEPDGVVALALPDAGSRVARLLRRRWWSVLPTHVQYFTRGSITRLLERHGFDPVEISTSPKAFTVAYYLDRLSGYSRPLARAATWLAMNLRLADRIWAPDLRDRMLVIARRRADTASPATPR